MPFFALSLILQVLLVVHVVRTGRDNKWIWIILVLPAAGGIAYLLLEVLPEFTRTHTARKLHRHVQDKLDPHRHVRRHSEALEVAETVDNQLALANALLDKQQYGEALPLLQRARSGFYRDDPALMLAQAEAHFGLGEWPAVIETLTALRSANPQYQSQDAHLLYTRALEASGQTAAADHEYAALVRYYNGPEAKCRYALLLEHLNRRREAQSLFREVVAAARHNRRHFERLHGEWLKLAETQVKAD